MGMGGGGSQSSRTVTEQKLSPQQEQLLNKVIPVAESFIDQPPQLFPGSTVAGFNPLQEAGQQAILSAAAGPTQDFVNNTIAANKFLLGPVLFPETNPALQQAIQGAVRPIEEQFTQSVLPNIRGEASLAGQFGGSRQGVAEGIATQGFLRQVGDTAAGLQSDAFGQGLDAFSRGLAFAPQTANLSFLPAQAISAVGDAQQQLEQTRLTESANRFTTEQLLPFLFAQDVAELAFGIPGGQGITTSEGPAPQGASPVSGALGGASLGLALSGGNPFGAAIGGVAGLLFSL